MLRLRIAVFVMMAAIMIMGNAAPAAAVPADPQLDGFKTEAIGKGFINIPGFDIFLDRFKNHGFIGSAWDIKARPYQTAMITLNDQGPFYITLGAVLDAHEDKAYPAGGLQFDALYLWRKGREWGPLQKMKLLELPEDWRILCGPKGNVFRVRPDWLRIDRDLIYNLAIHIPIGRRSDKENSK